MSTTALTRKSSSQIHQNISHNNNSPLLSLPLEMQVHILSYLPSFEDMMNFSAVSKSLRTRLVTPIYMLLTERHVQLHHHLEPLIRSTPNATERALRAFERSRNRHNSKVRLNLPFPSYLPLVKFNRDLETIIYTIAKNCLPIAGASSMLVTKALRVTHDEKSVYMLLQMQLINCFLALVKENKLNATKILVGYPTGKPMGHYIRCLFHILQKRGLLTSASDLISLMSKSDKLSYLLPLFDKFCRSDQFEGARSLLEKEAETSRDITESIAESINYQIRHHRNRHALSVIQTLPEGLLDKYKLLKSLFRDCLKTHQFETANLAIQEMKQHAFHLKASERADLLQKILSDELLLIRSHRS